MTFLAMLDLLEIELSSRAHEDEEERRHPKSADVAIAASAAVGKGSGKSKPTTKPACRDYLTENGCTRGGQCSFLHPPTVGRCLRCGSTKQAVADCKQPRQEKTAFPAKGKGKSSPPKPPKASNNNKGGCKGNAGSKAKSQPKPKSKATPKPKAEAGHIEIDWASQTHTHPFASSSVTIEEVAMHLAEGTFLQSDHTAFTFYTTFLPSFHSTSATDESGVLPPILDLDTGATHCLLPLSWLSPEEASSSKRIHLKVASGTSVRALLYNNVIYCSTVSRPLISAGQLKAMLDLRFHWDDSSPTLLVCSGGLKYILLEASVVHHLPAISSEEMMAILEAIHCFTSTRKMWNAKMWEEKLKRSLLRIFLPQLHQMLLLNHIKIQR